MDKLTTINQSLFRCNGQIFAYIGHHDEIAGIFAQTETSVEVNIITEFTYDNTGIIDDLTKNTNAQPAGENDFDSKDDSEEILFLIDSELLCHTSPTALVNHHPLSHLFCEVIILVGENTQSPTSQINPIRAGSNAIPITILNQPVESQVIFYLAATYTSSQDNKESTTTTVNGNNQEMSGPTQHRTTTGFNSADLISPSDDTTPSNHNVPLTPQHSLIDFAQTSPDALSSNLIEHIGYDVLIVNTQNEVHYANERFQEQTGYGSDEILGKDVRAIHVSDKPEHEDWSEATEMLDGIEEQWHGIQIIEQNDGGYYYMRVMITPTRFNGEKYYLVIGSDVTQQRLEKQRMNVLNRIIRHNLRNGLNIVEGRVNQIMKKTSNDDIEQYAQSVLEQTRSISETAEKAANMETLSSKEYSYSPLTNIEVLIRQTTLELEDEYPNISILYNIHNLSRKGVKIPKKLLRFAIDEAVENAVMHNDTVDLAITIHVEDKQNDPEYSVIRIHDTGSGIPEHETEVIEKRDETSLLHGSGIGLWIILWTVAMFGGDVDVLINEDAGTTVELIIPNTEIDSSVSSQ